MDLKNQIPSRARKNVPAPGEEEHPFLHLQRERNRLFDGFLRDWDTDLADRAWGGFTPRIDMTRMKRVSPFPRNCQACPTRTSRCP